MQWRSQFRHLVQPGTSRRIDHHAHLPAHAVFESVLCYRFRALLQVEAPGKDDRRAERRSAELLPWEETPGCVPGTIQDGRRVGDLLPPRRGDATHPPVDQ